MQVLVHYIAMSYVLCKSVYCSVMHLRAILGDQIFGLRRSNMAQIGPNGPRLPGWPEVAKTPNIALKILLVTLFWHNLWVPEYSYSGTLCR